ncbi:MAG: hypothetical protein V1743_06270, partial [Nanoarchaeota archaeon]
PQQQHHEKLQEIPEEQVMFVMRCYLCSKQKAKYLYTSVSIKKLQFIVLESIKHKKIRTVRP